MDTLRVAAADGRLIGCEMPQAFEPDDSESILCRRRARNRDRLGEYSSLRRALKQGIAALRLGAWLIANRPASCQTPGEPGQIVAFAVFQFDLDLADVGVSVG